MKHFHTFLLILLPFFSFSQVVSDSLIRSIGESIEHSLYENSTNYLSEIFHDSIFFSIFLKEDYGNQQLKEFNKSILTEKIGNTLGAEITKAIQKGRDYTFIQFSNDTIFNDYTLLFRQYSDEGGLNYHQYYLFFDKNHKASITDVFIFTAGQRFSEIIGQFYESIFNKIVAEEDIPDAKIDIDTLNEKHKLASFINNIDKYFIAKQYEEALKMVDSIDYYVNDNFLDLYRGNIYSDMGDIDQALVCFKNLRANYPYLPEAYSGLFDNYYQQRDFNKMVDLLQAIEENIGLTPQIIHDFIKSDYSNLLAKTSYLEWCKKKSVDLSTPKVVPLTEFQKEINADYANPEKSPLLKEDLEKFTSLDFFPFDEKYVVNARFVRTKDSESFEMETTTDRKPVYQKYGVAHFEIDDISYQLNIYQNQGLLTNEEYKDYLFLPFTDLSNGNESYGGGRFIDLKIPKGDSIEIDFNKAYNPYCTYNHKYSCPIPPAENYIEVEIKAGVKKFH